MLGFTFKYQDERRNQKYPVWKAGSRKKDTRINSDEEKFLSAKELGL